jgi:hypothetical protein
MPGVGRLTPMTLKMKIFTLLKLFMVWIVSYLLGTAIAATYWSWSNPELGGSEWFVEALAWSFPIFVIALPLVYLPLMFGLRWLLGGAKPFIAFPLVAAAFYLVPTSLFFMLYKEEWARDLFSHDNLHYHIMFLFISILFGLGFAVVLSKRAAQQLIQTDARLTSLSSFIIATKLECPLSRRLIRAIGVTDTFVKSNGRWIKAASVGTPIPKGTTTPRQ